MFLRRRFEVFEKEETKTRNVSFLYSSVPYDRSYVVPNNFILRNRIKSGNGAQLRCLITHGGNDSPHEILDFTKDVPGIK